MRFSVKTVLTISLMGMALGMAVNSLFTSSSASAGDHKIFAPQFCVPADHKTVFMQVDEVEELGVATFYCPLIRDDVDGNLSDVWVRLSDQDPEDGDAPSCCVHSVSVHGASEDVECRVAPGIEKNFSLHFPLNDFTEYDYGHYVVTCTLGIEDGIRSIRTNET